MKESDNGKVYYDSQADVLYIVSEKGKEEEFVEVSPGVHIELNKDGNVIGIEVLRASKLLSSVLEPLREKSLQK